MKDKIIILTDNNLNFVYSEVEIINFRRSWAANRVSDTLKAINRVAEDCGMDPDNVLLLALDQIRKGKIS